MTIKSFEKFVPFEKILDAQNLPKDSEAYYLLLSKFYKNLLQGKYCKIMFTNSIKMPIVVVLLNFRGVHKRDPLPNERSTNILKDEAKAVIEKYKLGDTIDHLIK